MERQSTVQFFTSGIREEHEQSLMLLSEEDNMAIKSRAHGTSQFRFNRHLSLDTTPSMMSFYSDYLRNPQVVAMVGLPARGKTYISLKLCRYLNWIGFKTNVFNLGNYRRQMSDYTDHSIFENGNEEGAKLREQCVQQALQDTMEWFDENGEIAIIDATNTTVTRRKKLKKFCDDMGYKLFFIESICTDPNIIEHNIMDVKVSSPDYKGKKPSEVQEDFLKRIDHYAENYVELNENDEPDISYIKLKNAGESVEIHNHEGPIQSRIIYYLMSLQLLPRNIYLTRHGESEFNMKAVIGGDSSLSENGREYAKVLTQFVTDMDIPNLKVWTSHLKRTIETAEHFKCSQERWFALNELDAGVCSGMNYDEIDKIFPELHEKRIRDKFLFRYPDGENYQDVLDRLEPIIMELERESNILVISHAAVIRCLLGYFLDIPSEKIPYIYVPLHTMIKITPITYGCRVQHVSFPVPHVEKTSTEEYLKKKKDNCQCVYTIK